jgi:T-complex protein 1 subunit alpha
MALANIVKSSLGPVGLDKMLVHAWEGAANAALLLRTANEGYVRAEGPLNHPRCLCDSQVDNIGDVTITNDGATILKQLEVEHPAARVLVDLAELQDSEVGDGTTSVVILAAELLKRANDLVRAKVHPTNIMAGYRLAVKEAVRYIKASLTITSDKMER